MANGSSAWSRLIQYKSPSKLSTYPTQFIHNCYPQIPRRCSIFLVRVSYLFLFSCDFKVGRTQPLLQLKNWFFNLLNSFQLLASFPKSKMMLLFSSLICCIFVVVCSEISSYYFWNTSILLFHFSCLRKFVAFHFPPLECVFNSYFFLLLVFYYRTLLNGWFNYFCFFRVPLNSWC